MVTTSPRLQPSSTIQGATCWRARPGRPAASAMAEVIISASATAGLRRSRSTPRSLVSARALVQDSQDWSRESRD